ncbi:MAG TPA: hypothetical protein VIJ68_04755 [Candidatus Saccharimonadales bacterium]
MSKSASSRQSSPNQEQWSVIAAWSLAAIVSTLAIIVWGQYYQWHIWPISSYQLFPVLGLLAFSIMWSHYMAVALRTYLQLDAKVLASYFRLTGYAVLVLICLHPGILIYQRFRDGYGLPPHSYESYVAPGLGWVTLIGTASLLVFLAFELRRVYGQRSWWHYVADLSDAAMLAILYHGLRLGSYLQRGWFRGVWAFYFVTLVAALAYKYIRRYQRTSLRHHPNT